VSGFKTTVQTDHSAIKFLMNKPTTNPRIICWLLLMQECDLTIQDKTGNDNTVVNHLLHSVNRVKGESVEKLSLDKHLFAIRVKTKWFAAITNYVVGGVLPQHFSRN
jgi:hypothetical protein